MATTFELEIATPDRQLLRDSATEAQIPARKGYMGVLPEHAPTIGELGDGTLTYTVGGRRHAIAIHGGWVEVLPDRVRVLANSAEKGGEVDVERARRALKRAQDRLIDPVIGLDIARALSAMWRAETRIRTAEQEAAAQPHR